MASPNPGYPPGSQPGTAPQSLSQTVDAQATTNTGGTGGAYFGVGQPQTGAGMGGNTQANNPFQPSAQYKPTYGPYDPSAVVPYAGNLGPGAEGKNVYVNANQAYQMYYQWTPSQQNDFRAKMTLINTTYGTADDATLAAAWGGLVDQSAKYHMSGQNVSPWDVLSKDISSNEGGKGKAGTTQTKELYQTTLTSAPDSNALFQAAAQSLIGRAPTADEQKNFLSNLNASERANPLHRTQEISYTPQGYPMYNDKNVTGGVNDTAKQNLAMQNLRGTTEYANYQASTTYMGALQELLSGGKV